MVLMFVASLAFSGFVFGQFSLQSSGLNGPVEQVVRLDYEDLREHFGAWELGEPSRRLLNRYDRQGRDVVFESQVPVGNPYVRHEYTYLANGNVRTDTYREGEKASYAIAYKSDGRTIAYEEYSPERQLTYRAEYSYDGNGNRTRMRGYEADGSLRFATNYEYDEEGRRVSEVSYRPDGSERHGTHWRYGADGRLSRHWSTDENGRARTVTLYRMEPGTTFRGEQREDMYLFSEKFLLEGAEPTSFSPTESSPQISTVEYWYFPEYLADGGHLPVREFDHFVGEVRVWQYDFDNHGNMVRREEGTMETRFGERQFVPSSITTMDIDYYESE